MKKILCLAALLLTVSTFAQKPAGDPKGGISEDLLKQIATCPTNGVIIQLNFVPFVHFSI